MGLPYVAQSLAGTRMYCKRNVLEKQTAHRGITSLASGRAITFSVIVAVLHRPHCRITISHLVRSSPLFAVFQ
jgi:hypothetical protein